VVYQFTLDDEVVFQKEHLRLFPFGSRIFGDSSSDIDILCISSFYITRENFFNGLQRLLSGMKEVSELVVVNAYIPIMKMKYNGVPVDLIFAETIYRCLPQSLVVDERLRKVMDTKSFLCIGGYRITRRLLLLVPDADKFNLCLRAVKTWARRRDIYSHMLGFLGGASWSILVANVCQLFPNDSPAELVSRFFLLYSSWNWNHPIILRDSEDLYDVEDEEWKRDDVAMHIVTPIRPASNTASNVSLCTRAILIKEFKRASGIVSLISWKVSTWHLLFERRQFYAEYPVYLRLSITAPTEEDHRKWEGWIKSRIPGLSRMLESHPNVLFCHPHVDVRHDEGAIHPTSAFYVGLLLKDACGSPPIQSAIAFMDIVCDWKEKREEMGLMMTYVHNPAHVGDN